MEQWELDAERMKTKDEERKRKEAEKDRKKSLEDAERNARRANIAESEARAANAYALKQEEAAIKARARELAATKHADMESFRADQEMAAKDAAHKTIEDYKKVAEQSEMQIIKLVELVRWNSLTKAQQNAEIKARKEAEAKAEAIEAAKAAEAAKKVAIERAEKAKVARAKAKAAKAIATKIWKVERKKYEKKMRDNNMLETYYSELKRANEFSRSKQILKNLKITASNTPHYIFERLLFNIKVIAGVGAAVILTYIIMLICSSAFKVSMFKSLFHSLGDGWNTGWDGQLFAMPTIHVAGWYAIWGIFGGVIVIAAIAEMIINRPESHWWAQKPKVPELTPRIENIMRKRKRDDEKLVESQTSTEETIATEK